MAGTSAGAKKGWANRSRSGKGKKYTPAMVKAGKGPKPGGRKVRVLSAAEEKEYRAKARRIRETGAG